MKRLGASVLLAITLIASALPSANAVVTPGSKCSKAGVKQTYKGKVYTCIKLGKKLYWNNGALVVVSTPKPTPTQTSTPTPTPTPTPKKLVPPKFSILSANFIESDILIKFDLLGESNVAFGDFKVEVFDSIKKRFFPLKAGFGYPASVFLAKKNDTYEFQIPAKDLDQSIPIDTVISNITQVRVQLVYFDKQDLFSERISIGWIESNSFAYVSNLPKPEFTLSGGQDTYVVTLKPEKLRLIPNYYGLIVEELITSETDKSKISLESGWRQATAISQNLTILVNAPTGGARWVRVKYVTSSGSASGYSDIFRVVP
jgi:hypothetical protein